MVLFSAAWTCGRVTPARADTAASLPVFLMKLRREVTWLGASFIIGMFQTEQARCQFKKSVRGSPGVFSGQSPPQSAVIAPNQLGSRELFQFRRLDDHCG